MRVTVLGGAAWNLMIHFDHLPDGRTSTLHPAGYHHAIGGAGAGKAMNLARLGVDVTLFAAVGADDAGDRVRSGLAGVGVDLRATIDRAGTPQHVNLMDPAGGRISIMLRNGSDDVPIDLDAVAMAASSSDAVVVDLAPWTRGIVDRVSASGRPLWTDLHDHDGASSWHAPFVDAADVVFVSGDRLSDPDRFLRSLIARGKRLVVCTLGRDGAIALDANGRAYQVPAVPDVVVVDSNGAGDAFFSGVLFGELEGVPIERALRYGTLAAALAVGSAELASAELSAARLRADLV